MMEATHPELTRPEMLPRKADRAARPQMRVGRFDIAVLLSCLSVLAGVATPRYFAAEVEVRATAVDALAGNVEGAAHFAHAVWKARGEPAVLELNGEPVELVHGYPVPESLLVILQRPELIGFVYDAGTFRYAQARGAACGVRYHPPAVPLGTPRVERLLNDC